jgi:hypothetical protein
MPTIHTMPRPEVLRELLTELIGLPVTVDRAPATPFDPNATAVVGTLVRVDDDGLGGVCRADLALAAALGAALTKMPPETVDRTVRRGTFEVGTLLDNFTETLNVASQVFNSADTPRLVLGSVIVLPGPLTPETTRLLQHGARRDLDVAIDGYGAGWLSVVVD